MANNENNQTTPVDNGSVVENHPDWFVAGASFEAADIDLVMDGIREFRVGVEEAGDNLTVAAAYATARIQYLLDKKFVKDTYAKSLGVSRAAVDIWLAMHQILTGGDEYADIVPGSVTWQCLVSKSGATRQPISWIFAGRGITGWGMGGKTLSKRGKATYSDTDVPMTREALDTALRAVFKVDTHGNLTTELRAAKDIKRSIAELSGETIEEEIEGSAGSSDDDGMAADAPVIPVGDLLGRATTSLTGVVELLGQMTDEQVEALASAVEGLNLAYADRAARIEKVEEEAPKTTRRARKSA